MDVAIAGLGRMGRAMAARLLELGCRVTVWNRSAAAADEFIALGARSVATPSALWAYSDLVLTSLRDDAAVEAVYLGSDGLIGAAAVDGIAIDTSTVLPATVQRIAEAAGAAGCDFLDSPVLGTVGPARTGQLISMVGGSAEAFRRAQPVLSHLTRRSLHVGASGAGAAMKLAVNIPMTAYWAALSDSLALAARYGLDRKQFLDIVQDSPAALAQLPLKRDLLLGRSTQVAYPIIGVVKDIHVMLAAAEAADLPVVAGALRTYARAVDEGRGDDDVATVALQSAHLVANQKATP